MGTQNNTDIDYDWIPAEALSKSKLPLQKKFFSILSFNSVTIRRHASFTSFDDDQTFALPNEKRVDQVQLLTEKLMQLVNQSIVANFLSI